MRRWDAAARGKGVCAMSKPPGDAATSQKTDLDTIARMRAQHARWLESGGAEGARADFSGMELADVRFPGADLRRARFADANLFRADFAGADLSEADFTGANLNRADLAGATLQRAVLDKADLSDAALGDARMEHASLVETSLQRAWLGRAHLEHATLKRADLHGAWVGRASLEAGEPGRRHAGGRRVPRHQLSRCLAQERLFRRRGLAGCRSLRRRPGRGAEPHANAARGGDSSTNRTILPPELRARQRRGPGCRVTPRVRKTTRDAAQMRRR